MARQDPTSALLPAGSAAVRLRSRRGFTLVELLVAASIGIVGMYASIAMSVVALRGNTESRDAVWGTYFAEHLLATVQAEGILWISDYALPDTGHYLNRLPWPAVPGQGTGWLPASFNKNNPDKRTGPMGNDSELWDAGILKEMPTELATRYCAHVRLFWVSTDMARAEVRVAWPRRNAAIAKYFDCPANMALNVADVGSVTLSAMVMKNVYVR